MKNARNYPLKRRKLAICVAIISHIIAPNFPICWGTKSSVPLFDLDMLSALKNCTLKSCITTISARNNTVVRSVAPSKPAGGFAKKSLAASARTRLFCTSRFEEGDNDREEQAFTYFYRKIRIGDEPEEPKAKKATKSSTRVVLPSTKQVAAKPVVKSSVASETTTKRVTSEDAGSRLDRFVTRLFPKLPHSRIQKLLRDKKV